MTGRIVWRPGSLEVVVDCEATPPRVTYIGAREESEWSAGSVGLPLAEVRVAGEGNEIASSERLMGSALSRRMRYLTHTERIEGDESLLEVIIREPETLLTVATRLRSWRDIPVVRWETEVINDGRESPDVQLVSSFAIGGLTAPDSEWWNEQTIAFADNSWFREAAWQRRWPGELGLDDVGLAQWRYPGSRASFALTGRGSWSSGGHLPLGMLSSHDGSRSILWQIENNGGWRWEIGDWGGSLYVVGSGPTDQAHAWTRRLDPGERFHAVPAAIAIAEGDDEAFAAMNAYRRRIRRPHPDNEVLPVIFNDFMNALMGDPTTEKLLPLIDAAAAVGAEYFCIDAGWHAEDRAWWDAVGEWRESSWRFPGGLAEVTDRIRARGMIPGLWLEPESIGARSAAADQLPADAFFTRDGARVVEAGRYQLDFRHPAVIERLNRIVERLITDYGLGYLKFDYNVDVTQGTDISVVSPGDGQLEHGRAYLGWVASLLDRHPDLVIENCASGGQRMDYASLAVHPVQSTSDNQDPLHYAPIAASVATAVTPEQGAVWAYPNAEWSDELIAFSMVNSLLGRVHLGGRIDALDRGQMELVGEAIAVYTGIRGDHATSTPFWPLGLPSWHDEAVSVGLNAGDCSYLSVWRRSGPTSIVIPLPEFAGTALDVAVMYPVTLPTHTEWDSAAGMLTVVLPDEPAARLLCVREVL